MRDTGTMQPMILSDEQREFRAAVRSLAEERIAPRAAAVDASGEFPWDNFKDCLAMDIPGLGIPTEYGGSGADHVTHAILIEELARVCASTSLIFAVNALSTIPLINWASEELKQKYLTRIASGESQGSYCLSEADAGSDAAAMKARAVRDGDEYVLSGSKYWITNAGVSDVYVVFAKTDPDAGARGVSCFVVEKDHGLRFGKPESKLGMHGSPTREVILDGVRIPAANLVGEEGQGFKIAMHTLDRSRTSIAAQAVGIAQGAIDVGTAYVKERKAFGRPIADFQALQFMLADMAMKTEAA
ncbi:MAG TPA: acyl-CoA dehydrogenase family protein, partial [Acidimicrobiales bacterium]|nr:acyl-CoA dehydrogenase family protein [Acidimicrobiales bacterium]